MLFTGFVIIKDMHTSQKCYHSFFIIFIISSFLRLIFNIIPQRSSAGKPAVPMPFAKALRDTTAPRGPSRAPARAAMLRPTRIWPSPPATRVCEVCLGYPSHTRYMGRHSRN